MYWDRRGEATGDELGLVRRLWSGSEVDVAVKSLGQDLPDPFLLKVTFDLVDDSVERSQPFVVEAGVEGGADQVEGELDMFKDPMGLVGG